MNWDFSLIKRHPYATAGIVVAGGLVLFLLWRAQGSSGDATAVSSSVDPAVLQYNLAQDQLAANVNMANISASSALAQLKQQGENNLALAKEAHYETAQTASVSMAQIAASERTSAAQIAAGVEQSRLVADVQNTAVLAGLQGLMAQITSATIQNDRGARLQEELARINADVTKSQIAATSAVNFAQIDSNSRTAINLAANNRKTAQDAQSSALLGGLLGGATKLVGALF